MSPARRIDGAARLDCRLKPGGRRDRLLDIGLAGDGRRRLGAEVRAPAEGGKANAALIKLLSRHFRIPASRWSIFQGAGRREKTLAIRDVSGEEWAAIEAALAALETGRNAG